MSGHGDQPDRRTRLVQQPEDDYTGAGGYRTRLYVFPGGVFETTDYGDCDDSPGFYLEFQPDRLPQRVPGVVDLPRLESADAETCGRVLRLLRELPASGDGCPQ